MPRIARNSMSTSFFHVMVQGINKEYIFNKDIYIEKYLELISKYKKEFNINLLAYCIMSNHAHLLINVNNIKDMSMFMHKINCIYANYYNFIENRVGVLFRNRYTSEPIYNEKHLIHCIHYIHMNPVKAKMVKDCLEYKYSSFNDYIKSKGCSQNNILLEIFGNIDWSSIFKVLNNDIIFNDIECDNNDLIDVVISKFEKTNNKSLQEIIKDEDLFRRLIKLLKEKYHITYAQIANKCNISRGKFQYFLRKRCK